jgi:hypothetical protein
MLKAHGSMPKAKKVAARNRGDFFDAIIFIFAQH